jgi:hypothetical protein
MNTTPRIADLLFGDFSERLANLEGQLQDYLAGQPPQEEACEVLAAFNRAKAEVKLTYDSFALRIGAMMKDDKVLLSGGGEVERNYSTKRTKWQHKDLASVVAQKLHKMSIDMDTGEVKVDPEGMAKAMLNYVQPSYWKVTQLEKIGINPDNYCESGDSRMSVIVRQSNGGTSDE